MRSSIQLALAWHDRQASYFHIWHTRRGERPARCATGEPEHAKVIRHIDVTADIVVGNASDWDITDII